MATSVRSHGGYGWVRRALVVSGVAGAALAVAGCGAGVVTPAQTAVGQFFQAGAEPPKTIDPELLRPAIECPPVSLQLGTEAYRRADGDGADAKLRYQASITRTARECKKTDEGTLVRVGVSGRIVEGIAGAPGKVELPVRIVVRESGETTHSRLHRVAVERSGPSQSWAFVDESIVVDVPESTQIFVGFDES